ncbi:MAG: cytochrome b6-f complex subunit PetL [Thermosynechococcaceae cyanobacterium]
MSGVVAYIVLTGGAIAAAWGLHFVLKTVKLI